MALKLKALEFGDADGLKNNLVQLALTLKAISDSNMYVTGSEIWNSPSCSKFYSHVSKLVKTCLDTVDICDNVSDYLDNVCENYEAFENSQLMS